MARLAERSGVPLLLLTLLVILGSAARAAPWLGERLAAGPGSSWLIDAAILLGFVGAVVYALRAPPSASVGAILLVVSAGLAFQQERLTAAMEDLLRGDYAGWARGLLDSIIAGLETLGVYAQAAVVLFAATAAIAAATAPRRPAAPPSRPPAPRPAPPRPSAPPTPPPAPAPASAGQPSPSPPAAQPAAAAVAAPASGGGGGCPRLSEWARLIAEGRVDVIERCWVGRELYGYVVEKLLGVGGFGVVLKARSAFEASRYVAIKVMHPIMGAARVGDAVTSRSLLDIADSLRRESRNLEELSRKSPFIVGLLAIHMDLDMLRNAIKRGNTEIYLRYPPAIIMEYMAGGDLNGFLADMIRRYGSERLRRSPGWRRASAAVLYAVASALSVIHESGYIHSDVKPQNVLFTSPPPRDPEQLGSALTEAVGAAARGGRGDPLPKLSDLGSAVKVGDVVAEFTALYADPALLLYEALCISPNADLSRPECRTPPLAHPSMDIYSLGLMAAQLYAAVDSKTLRGWREAGTLDDPARARRFLEGLGVPGEVAGFVARMLSPRPEERPSSRESASFFARQAGLPAPAAGEGEAREAETGQGG